MICNGLEQLVASPPGWMRGKRLGLLANQASTDRNFIHARDLIAASFPGQLRCLFSPQHGFFSEKQDNMVESGHVTDTITGLPIYSLYGETRKPYPEMFADIDILLIDLIDVGTRVYTFIWTVVYCMQVAADTGVRVVILDRPNPIGGNLVEGNLLEPEYSSFVGLCSIPMRHGMTIGELAIYCRRELHIEVDCEVITMAGWKRSMQFADTGFPWVFPSPNMPAASTALVYPGQVIWEGTSLSEGRGTTLPFEIFGAPYLDHQHVLDFLRADDCIGCRLRPLIFEPCSGKWAGHACTGFQIHVHQPELYNSYRTSLALLQACMLLYPVDFSYKEPPYEYEFERLPMDLILGSKAVRKALEEGTPVQELESEWSQELDEFHQKRSAVLLYGE
ncbi:exo-beta-N-acetylmuramidase NamZ family protein [Desulfogranum japonicum]|uniref:exo-beta-N-acetylmuramidase NamZ family protein n=1 Tax=Desulfogranum japonicum TaxID=231447 RepID=UPI00041CD85A|nr:DUF1343 domain-containing protein [Desulfogranum japonicum]